MTIELGLCHCGCGGLAPIATDTNTTKGIVKGQPRKYIFGHVASTLKKPVTLHYRTVKKGGISKKLHRLRAERALGKPLPAGAEVHHADGTTGDESPLVICQNRAYHALLHVRMRIKAVGGIPDLDAICSGCGQVKRRTEFHCSARAVNGLSCYCRSCAARRARGAYVGIAVRNYRLSEGGQR